MRLSTLPFFLSLISVCFCKTCRINKKTGIKEEKALKRYIEKCGGSSYPPVNKNETAGKDHVVSVRMSYLLQTFRFDLYEETITMFSWNYFDWQDDRLEWRPEDFNGLKKTAIMSTSIWSPSLKLMNNGEAGDFDFFYTGCNVNNTGHVRCAIRATHTVFCKSALRNWPYEIKLCDLEFDQWRPGEVKVLFNLNHIMYVVDSFQGEGWKILRGQVFKNLTTGIQTTIKFALQRMAEGLECTIVVPSFVIAMLTVASILLDYKKNTRIAILCLSIISHFAVSNEIDKNLPKHTPDTPVVLRFISSSLMLTAIVFVSSFLFRRLAERKSQTPKWMDTLNDLARNSHFKYLVITKWDVDDEDPDQEKSTQWNNIICIVNSVFFLVVVITYICLFAVFMPRKTPSTINFETYVLQ